MKRKSSKRYKKLLEKSKDKKKEAIEDAIPKVKQNCNAKFDESIDISHFEFGPPEPVLLLYGTGEVVII